MTVTVLILAATAIAGFSPDAAHENRPELRARILSQQVRHQTRRLEEAIAWAQRLQHQLHQARAALEEPPRSMVPEPSDGATGAGSPGQTSAGGSSWAAGGAALCSSACVQCESSGNPDALSDDGIYYGLYQFDYQTWTRFGGSPSTYGHASVSEQTAVAGRVTYDAWPHC